MHASTLLLPFLLMGIGCGLASEGEDLDHVADPATTTAPDAHTGLSTVGTSDLKLECLFDADLKALAQLELTADQLVRIQALQAQLRTKPDSIPPAPMHDAETLRASNTASSATTGAQHGTGERSAPAGNTYPEGAMHAAEPLKELTEVLTAAQLARFRTWCKDQHGSAPAH